MAHVLTVDEVKHVAKLARLAMPADQLETFTRQLGSILGYVEQLDKAQVTDAEPLAQAAGLQNVLRNDEPGSALTTEAVLQNAPATDGIFFKVPQVIGQEEDSAG